MVYLAADRMGCHADTIHAYARRYKSVQECIDHEREKILDIGELKLVQKVMDGDDGMIKFLLSTRGKKRGYTTGVEVTGAEGTPLQVIVVLPDNGRNDRDT